MATYFVNPRPPNGNPDDWAIVKRGNSRASSVERNKVTALSRARKIADDGDTIVIKDAEGNVMKRNTVSGAGRRSAKKGMRRNIGSSPFDDI